MKYTLTTEQQGTWEFQGELLGQASTRTTAHNHADGDLPPAQRETDPALRRRKCNACRWHEARIYADDDTDGYILYTEGGSAIPGEIPFRRMTRATTPLELLSVMVVRTANPYVPVSSERALAQAADADDDLREAYLAMRGAGNRV